MILLIFALVIVFMSFSIKKLPEVNIYLALFYDKANAFWHLVILYVKDTIFSK